MTQYLLAVHDVDDVDNYPSPEAMQAAFEAVGVFNNELMASGSWLFGGGLQPASTATVVRVENGDPLMTDGPFMETKEHIGGFWIIEAADLDAALDWATKGSIACGQPVEVRPFQEEPEA